VVNTKKSGSQTQSLEGHMSSTAETFYPLDLAEDRLDLKEMIDVGTSQFCVVGNDPSFGGLIPDEYSRWAPIAGNSPENVLLVVKESVEHLRDFAFFCCLLHRYEFEVQLDQCLFHPVARDEFRSLWSKYHQHCDNTLKLLFFLKTELGDQLKDDARVSGDIGLAIRNISIRQNLADQFSAGAHHLRGFGRLNLWEDVPKDNFPATADADRASWRCFAWVVQVIAMKMRLAASELEHEVESWTKGAKRHSKSLSRSLAAMEGWHQVLANKAKQSAFERSFKPFLSTLNGVCRHLKMLVESLNKDAEPKLPEGFKSWGEVFARMVDDINYVCAAQQDELWQRDSFLSLHARPMEPPTFKVLCYRGISETDPIVAQCLNVDLMATGRDHDDAVNRLAGLVRRVVDHIAKTQAAELAVAPARFLRSFFELGKDNPKTFEHERDGLVFEWRTLDK
jgi:hypothetical protein